MNEALHGNYRRDGASVDASPVKSFFVSMLTRDIRLEDAILDLLDNCVDGILRTNAGKGSKPYVGFKADVEFGDDSFSISDNCGGIPWDLHEYAFRMGRSSSRPTDASGTVGVYGIGMKRAIFKIGEQCLISTRNGIDQYEVEITPDWLSNEQSWDIPVRSASITTEYDGTTILIGNLHPGISSLFHEDRDSFTAELTRMISTHYAYIIDKGFQVRINGSEVKPRTTLLAYDSRDTRRNSLPIRPFVFKSDIGGVDVYLAVGFTRPIPSEHDIEQEQESPRHSSIDAGWTILCNDRAVIHCDRTELTGWGERPVPRYHTQFIAISGIVDLHSSDPSKLPTTTTKRGIDASSPLYLQIKNKMREGMKLFTDYTYNWKGRAEESREQIESCDLLSLAQIKERTANSTFRVTRNPIVGYQVKPRLPAPPRRQSSHHRISYAKHRNQVEIVAEHLDVPTMSPSEVGERCFDLIYEEANL